MLNKKFTKLLPFVAILGITGCGSIFSPVSQRPVINYEINDTTVQGIIGCSKAQTDDSIYISPMQANTPYDSGKMYYSAKPNELDYFGFSQWVSSPPDMLTQSITKKVLASCIYKGIVTSSALADANYRLVTKLITLRQKVLDKDNSEVSLVVYAELIDLERNSIVKTKVFVETMPAPTGPQAMADGINQLTVKFDNELITWLRVSSN